MNPFEWKKRAKYGEMYWNNAVASTIIETANIPIMLQYSTVGLLNGFTYHAGSTGVITAFSDGTGKVNVASAAHGLETGDIISIRGTTNYNGVWVITYIDAGNFSIPDVWVANDGVSDWDQGCYLLSGGNINNVCIVEFTLSIAESGAAGSDLHVQSYANGIACVKCESHVTTSNNKLNSFAGHSLASVLPGYKFSLAIESTGTNNILVNHGNLSIHQL